MKVPNHIAIIPDGNRRWASDRALNPWDGHSQGLKQFWDTSYSSSDAGVPHITFWGGSYDNLKKRTKVEVSFLFKLMAEELAKPTLLNQCLKRENRFRVIGEWRDFIKDSSIVSAIESIEKKTAHFKEKSLNILFAYDGKREMLAAVSKLQESGKKVSGESLRKNLWTGELPDVDLVIRTGGEPHWSAGFLMWLTANSQFYFTDLLWPDFSKQEFKKALIEYERRERRLGK